MKKDEIYRKFRREIISGILKEGDKLPTEFECADMFQVSRDTIREALKRLENDGFIERVKAKGTFVKIPDIETENRNISFLVPCCEYLRCTNIHSMNLMFELIAQAAVAGWRVMPVIYSKTNAPNNIWWENLSHIHTGSRVIVNHSWFSPYFETLTAIGARVAYIDNDREPEKEISEHTENWINFIEQDRIAARKSFAYLRQSGCRRIAVFMPNIMNKSNTIADEYRKFVKRSGQEELIFETPRTADPEDMHRNVPNRIKEIYRRTKFDGILIHANEFYLSTQGKIQTSLDLPEDFPMVVIPTQTDQIFSSQETAVPVVHYPVDKMAGDMIQHLINGQYIKQKYYYEPSIRLFGKEIKINNI